MTPFFNVFDFFATLMCFLDHTLGLGFAINPGNFSPRVITSTGTVEGVCLSEADNVVAAFLGIPFAEPPVGDLRYKKPTPVRNWQGIYQATKKPPPCMQYSQRNFPWEATSSPNEDCLYLNLWIPGNHLSYIEEGYQDLKPVLVFIYGGGYYSGSSDIDLYDGATLSATGDIIVVSINYRVGSYGFFISGTEDAPGNLGLYDQNLAFTWLKSNIEFFGGDPNKITLLGQSAGSVSVVYHILSPLSRNLFQRVILHSGSAFHPVLTGTPEKMIFVSNIFSSIVGCADDKDNLFTNPKKVVSCLRKKDALELSKQESTLMQAPFLFLPFHGDEIVPQDPITALRSGNFEQTEMITGITRNEGAIFLNYLIPQFFDSVSTPILDTSQAKNIIHLLFQNSTHPVPNDVANFYLKGVGEDDSAGIVKAVADSYGDFVFSCPTIFTAENFDRKDVYFYYFTHRPSNSRWGEWVDVAHMDDMRFLFGDPIRHPSNYTSEERALSRNIIQMWANFARYGAPLPSKGQGIWPKFTKTNPQFIELNTKTKVIGRGIKTEVCNFWRPYFTTN